MKLAVVAVVATMLLLPEFGRLELTAGMDLGELLALLQRLTLRLLIGVLAVMGIIASVDILYQRFDHVKRLRMSRQEMRSEEHTSELQSLMRSSYAVFCLKKKYKATCKTT